MKYRYVLLLFCFIYACSAGDADKVTQEKNTLDTRTEFGNNIKMTFTENSLKKGYMTAPTMMKKQDSTDRTYFPNGMKLQIYDSLGNLSSTITAKYGEQNHTKNEMIARDSVLVVNRDGQSMRANEMIWNPKSQILYSNGSVSIIKATEIINGDTLVADENLKKYRLKKVTGIVQVKE